MTRQFRQSLVALAVPVAMGSAALVIQTPSAAQTRSAAQTSSDPWTQVPAFPTTCYRGEDFSGPADKASADLEAAIARQEATNASIEEEFKKMDMAEMARRMQAFMMKDPQRAAAMMQAQQGAAASAGAGVQRAAANVGKIEEDLKDHTAKFQAAVKGARDPIDAQIKQLATKALPAHGDDIRFATAAEEAQYLGLMARLNTDYDKICGAWWGATGTFQGWLRSLKTYTVDNLIPSDDQVGAAKALQFAIMDTPTGGYRSTAAMKHVREYLRRARGVYELRPGRIQVPKSAR